MEIMRITCGARTRPGHPCRRKGSGKGGRCPNHGGKSTGPRTIEGRNRIANAQRARWQRWRLYNARVLPELSRKQELRHIRTFDALTARGVQAAKLMDPQYGPRLAGDPRWADANACSTIAVETTASAKSRPPARPCAAH